MGVPYSPMDIIGVLRSLIPLWTLLVFYCPLFPYGHLLQVFYGPLFPYGHYWCFTVPYSPTDIADVLRSLIDITGVLRPLMDIYYRFFDITDVLHYWCFTVPYSPMNITGILRSLMDITDVLKAC